MIVPARLASGRPTPFGGLLKLQLSLLLFACAGSAQQSNFFPGFGFEVNEGQFPAHVTAVWQSTLTGPVYTTAEGVIRSARTQVRWRGMNAYQRVVGIPQPGVHRNLYQSNDAAQWRTNQPFWDGIKIGTLSENPTAEVTLRGTLSDPSLPGVRLGRLSLEMRLRPGESLENFSLEVLGWTSSPGLGPGWVQFVGGESPGVASFTIEAFQTIGGERRALTANFNLQSNFVLGVTVSGGRTRTPRSRSGFPSEESADPSFFLQRPRTETATRWARSTGRVDFCRVRAITQRRATKIARTSMSPKSTTRAS
jgi:hypothetical protein